MRGRWLAVLTLALAACGGDDGGGAPDGGPDGGPDAPPGPDLRAIDPAVLHVVDITIAPGDLDAFDHDQTQRVACDVRWDGVLLARSGCRKKGYAGSIDAVTGKPAFSIKFDELVPGQKLGAFDKLVLDNGLQDPSLVHEHLAYEVFRRAGVPAHRTAFALVSLGGDPRGVYVIVEPVDKEFLRDRYGAANDEGNLYEAQVADFATDPGELELKDEAGRSRADLEAAAAAVVGAPDATFAAEVGARLDLDELTRYLAVELALDAQDGFAIARNNYYLYHRPDTDRFVMLPHGQDVILTNPAFEPDYPPVARLPRRMRAIPALSASLDAAIAGLVTPGGALDPDHHAARLAAALALVETTDRDDDFTAGDLATMRRWVPAVAARVRWRAARLRGDLTPGRCGDGVVHAAEQCDDGNLAAGDGCDPGCRPECTTITGAGATWRLCPAALDREAARQACGALYVPASPAEAEAVARLVRRHLGSVDPWLGLTDAAVEGTWVTDAGGAPPYLDFAEREPSGGTGENCAVLETGQLGRWRDRPCDVDHPSICRAP